MPSTLEAMTVNPTIGKDGKAVEAHRPETDRIESGCYE
jgi:hypothetical protein